MLNIHFGELDGEVKFPDSYFDNTFEDEWFDDPFVKSMVLSIDKTEVISAYNMISPVLGGINYKSLSTGVKNLILAYKTDCIIDASYCGDNCAKWLLKIAEMKDLVIVLYNIMGFECDFTAKILNNNKIIHTYKDYVIEGALLL